MRKRDYTADMTAVAPVTAYRMQQWTWEEVLTPQTDSVMGL